MPLQVFAIINTLLIVSTQQKFHVEYNNEYNNECNHLSTFFNLSEFSVMLFPHKLFHTFGDSVQCKIWTGCVGRIKVKDHL